MNKKTLYTLCSCILLLSLTACGSKDETSFQSSQNTEVYSKEENSDLALAKAKDAMLKEDFYAAKLHLDEAQQIEGNREDILAYKKQIDLYQAALQAQQSGDLKKASNLFDQVARVNHGFTTFSEKADQKHRQMQREEEKKVQEEQAKLAQKQKEEAEKKAKAEAEVKAKAEAETKDQHHKASWDVEKNKKLATFMQEWQRQMNQHYVEGQVNPNKNTLSMTASYFDGKGFEVKNSSAPIVASSDGDTKKEAYNVVAVYASTPGKDTKIRRYLFAIYKGEPLVLVNETAQEKKEEPLIFTSTKNRDLAKNFAQIARS